MTAVHHPTNAYTELEAALWTAAGPEYSNFTDMEGNNGDPSLREKQFGQAIVNITNAWPRETPDAPESAVARRHYMVVRALRHGRLPSAALHHVRRPEVETSDEALVAAAGNFLRQLAEKEMTATNDDMNMAHGIATVATTAATKDSNKPETPSVERARAPRQPSPQHPEWNDDTDLSHIAAAAIDGEEGAIDRLAAEIHPFVLRYCRGKLGRQETAAASAEDIAQEICLAVIKALPTYTVKGLSFRAFVYGIAGHKVIDAFRTIGRSRTDPVDELPESPVTALGPEAHLLDTELGQAVAQLLDGLSKQQQDVLKLRIMLGFSAEETATIVGSTPGAVRVTQHRALKKLRDALGEKNDTSDA